MQPFGIGVINVGGHHAGTIGVGGHLSQRIKALRRIKSFLRAGSRETLDLNQISRRVVGIFYRRGIARIGELLYAVSIVIGSLGDVFHRINIEESAGFKHATTNIVTAPLIPL